MKKLRSYLHHVVLVKERVWFDKKKGYDLFDIYIFFSDRVSFSGLLKLKKLVKFS